MNQLQLISLVLSVCSFLIPLIAGFKNKRSLLWKYILLSFSCDIAMILLKRVALVNINPLANIYVLAEFCIIAAYYSRAIPTARKALLFITGLVLIPYIIQLLAGGLYIRYGKFTALFSFTYILFSLYGFYTILKQTKHSRVERSAFFWVNVALLVGFSGKFLVFLFEDFLNQHYKHLWEGIWLLFKAINVVINILFAIALTRKDE